MVTSHRFFLELDLPAEVSGLRWLAMAVSGCHQLRCYQKGRWGHRNTAFCFAFVLLLWFELCNKNKLDKHFEAADFKRVLDKHVWVAAEHIWSYKPPCPNALLFYRDCLEGLACAEELGHAVHLFVPNICTWSFSYPGAREALCTQCTFLTHWWNCSATKLFVPCGGKHVPSLGKMLLSLMYLLVTCPTLQ